MDQGPQRIAFHSPCTLQHGMKHPRPGRGDPARDRPLAAAGRRHAPVLRLRRHVLGPAAGARRAQLKANKLAALEVVAARRDRHRQHRLPRRTSQSGTETPGAPLDRAARRAHARRRPHERARGDDATAARARDRRAPRYRHFLAIPTRWMDNDTYGHVNNVTYYSYFDTVVNEHLIRAAGSKSRAPGDRARRRDLVPVLSPAVVSRHDRRRSRVTRLGRSSVTYAIGIFRDGDAAAAATGRFVHVWVDRATRRPVDVPPPVRAALAPLVVAGREGA